MALSKKVRGALAGYLFLLPNFIGFLIFTSLPVIASFLLSFVKWDMAQYESRPEWVGLANFTELLGFRIVNPRPGGELLLPMFLLLVLLFGTCIIVAIRSLAREKNRRALFAVAVALGCVVGMYINGRQTWQVWWPTDERFWYYTFNTIFLMLAIPVSMMGSLFLAMVMNQKLRGIVVYRTLFFMPSIVAGVGTYLLWRWIYSPDFGMLNLLLSKIGIPGPAWLTSPGWVKPAIMLMGFWASVGGYNMILYLAALQGVPPELYEAADIDGASRWQRFWAITWPLVSPTTFFIFTMSMIGGFQAGFDEAYIMTGGGPAGASTTIAFYIYNNAYVWQKMGYAAAISYVMFVAVFVVTLLNFRFGGRVVHY